MSGLRRRTAALALVVTVLAAPAARAEPGELEGLLARLPEHCLAVAGACDVPASLEQARMWITPLVEALEPDELAEVDRDLKAWAEALPGPALVGFLDRERWAFVAATGSTQEELAALAADQVETHPQEAMVALGPEEDRFGFFVVRDGLVLAARTPELLQELLSRSPGAKGPLSDSPAMRSLLRRPEVREAACFVIAEAHRAPGLPDDADVDQPAAALQRRLMRALQVQFGHWLGTGLAALYLEEKSIRIKAVNLLAGWRAGGGTAGVRPAGLPPGFKRSDAAAVWCTGLGFAAMAFSEYARATGDEEALQRARDTYRLMVNLSRTPGGLTPKVFPSTRVTKSHVLAMILLATTQELRQVDADPLYMEVVDASLDQILNQFLKRGEHALFETVGANGERLDSPEGHCVCPGHAIETAWFIMHEGCHRDDPRLIQDGLDILSWSLEWGWDKKYGGILYFVDVEGKPPEQLEWDMKLWWPHTEALYALLLAYHLTGQVKYLDWHEKVHEWAFSHFPDPEYGEWFGYLHRDGSLASSLKGSMWKGPFHLPRMLLQSLKLLEEIKGKTNLTNPAL